MTDAEYLKLREAIQAELLRELKKHGPMLLWVGESFPAGCIFRGLNLGQVEFVEWLGVRNDR